MCHFQLRRKLSPRLLRYSGQLCWWLVILTSPSLRRHVKLQCRLHLRSTFTDRAFREELPEIFVNALFTHGGFYPGSL